jgi:small subunit ribosomal protein S2
MSTDTPDTKTLIERLFTAGAHFGFSKSRRHPTVKPYLFGNKLGTDIFDLEKTSVLLENAKTVLNTAGKEGKTVVFVSTKDETAKIVMNEAIRAEMPYVTNRWIGGTLTNFSEIKKRLTRLATLTQEGESGELERKYTKKERVVIGRELDKLTFNFGGIKALERIPQMMVVVDPRHDAIAIQEATDVGIPVVAVLSSDNDLSKVTHPVLVNDALQSSITLAMQELTDAYIAGKSEYVPKQAPKANEGRARTSDTRPRTR